MLSEPNILTQHIRNDHIVGNDGVLNIIDDYHAKTMDDSQIEFFTNAFKALNNPEFIVDGKKYINTVKIFYQIKISDPSVRSYYGKLCRLSQEMNIESRQLPAFIHLCTTKRVQNFLRDKRIKEIDSPRKLRDLFAVKSEEVLKCLRGVIDFGQSLSTAGINVEYKAYSSSELMPPFHGRYWLGNKSGYIVDGSLNTYGKGKIFVQLMDEENYEMINSFFKRNITNNVLCTLSTTEITELLNKIFHGREND